MSKQSAPIKESPIEGVKGLFTRPWIRWFQNNFQGEQKIVRNPSNPYTVKGDNELIFINTSSVFDVNLKPQAEGLKVRVINVKSSTANVRINPNGSDLVYGVNDFENVTPGEARDLDCNKTDGYY